MMFTHNTVFMSLLQTNTNHWNKAHTSGRLSHEHVRPVPVTLDLLTSAAP